MREQLQIAFAKRKTLLVGLLGLTLAALMCVGAALGWVHVYWSPLSVVQ